MSEIFIKTAEEEIPLSVWRELTSRAAYLQGITLLWSSDETLKPRDSATLETYSPLDDDGHAFRLANQLIMRIEHGKNYRHVYNRVTVSAHGRSHVGAEVTYKHDRNEATRRAIVMTAYERYRDG